MVAIYVFPNQTKGINLLGIETVIFRETPSCFGLRFNDVLLVNVSFDFFCSAGCGLPAPRELRLIRGGQNHGKCRLIDLDYSLEIRNPITSLELYKPVMWLYQPIKLPSAEFSGKYYGHINNFDMRIAERTLMGNDRLGALFRQSKDGVSVHSDLDEILTFNSVTGDECARYQDIAATVYEAQVSMVERQVCEWVEPNVAPQEFMQFVIKKIEEARHIARSYREHPAKQGDLPSVTS